LTTGSLEKDIPVMNKSTFVTTAAATVCAALPGMTGPLQAAPGDWQYTATIYGWYAGIDGKLNYEGDGGDSGGPSLDAGSVIDNLKMAFMGTLGARKDEWSGLLDVAYLNLGNKKTASVALPGGEYIDARVDLGLKGWQVGLYGGYNIYDTERATMDAVAGLRYLYVETNAKLAINGPLPPSLPDKKLSRNGSVLDGVVGVRGQAKITGNWFIPYHADLGAGQSRLTWQAMAGIGYEAGWGDTLLVYRHLEWDQDDDKLLQNMSFSGPALAFRFHF
jgi:hypothetical protein